MTTLPVLFATIRPVGDPHAPLSLWHVGDPELARLLAVAVGRASRSGLVPLPVVPVVVLIVVFAALFVAWLFGRRLLRG